MIKLLETQLRELKSGQDFDGKKEFILKKSLELFELYLDEKKLDEADRLLFDLKEKKYSVDEFLYQLYTNQDFWENSSSSKQELSKKYLDLLDKFKDDEERFKKLKEQLDLIYDDKTDRVTSELNSVKKQINKYEEQIKSLEDMFSKYIKDEKVFNKVDEVNSQLRNSHIKLDNISDTIKNNHDILIQILLNGIIETNKNLIAGVQKIYKNSKINENLVQTLNSTITYMNQRVKNLSLHGDKQPDIKWVEEIIRECNSTLYTDIEKLYKDDTDSIKDDLFRKSLAVAEKRHQEHLVSLKISLTDKDREISNLSFQLKELTKWLDMINNEYETLKISSSEFEQKSLELTKMNQQLKDNISKSDTNTIDTLELMEYQNKVENLKKIIEKLKGKNEQLDELKESISLSSKTADSLVSLENKYEEKIALIEDRFKKIKHNPQNEKRLRKIFDKIIIFEKRLDDIKRRGDIYPIKVDPNITLHLLEKDLEKIDKIIRERQSKLYASYCMTRNILIGVIAMSTLLLYEPFWEIYKELLNFFS
jgi:DNA repair exonuclease SbcCD ATPase subunit